jgi:hypothetical protein
MALTEDDFKRIGEYVKGNLPLWREELRMDRTAGAGIHAGIHAGERAERERRREPEQAEWQARLERDRAEWLTRSRFQMLYMAVVSGTFALVIVLSNVWGGG